MWFFILLILIGAFSQTVLKLSLLKRSYRIAITFAMVVGIAFCYHFATLYNLKDLDSFLQNKNTLATLCFIVMIQELTSLIIGAILLRKKMLNEKIRLFHFLALMPSTLFPLGQFLLLVFIFNKYSGVNYFYSNLLLSGGIFLAVLIFCEICQFVKFEKNIKLNVSNSLTMVFAAMFLPVILNNSVPKTNYITVNFNMFYGVLSVLGMIIFFAIITPFIKKIKHKTIKLILK